MHRQMMDPIGPTRTANFLGHRFLVRYRPHASWWVDLESTLSPINPLNLGFGRSPILERISLPISVGSLRKCINLASVTSAH